MVTTNHLQRRLACLLCRWSFTPAAMITLLGTLAYLVVRCISVVEFSWEKLDPMWALIYVGEAATTIGYSLSQLGGWLSGAARYDGWLLRKIKLTPFLKAHRKATESLDHNLSRKVFLPAIVSTLIGTPLYIGGKAWQLGLHPSHMSTYLLVAEIGVTVGYTLNQTISWFSGVTRFDPKLISDLRARQQKRCLGVARMTFTPAMIATAISTAILVPAGIACAALCLEHGRHIAAWELIAELTLTIGYTWGQASGWLASKLHGLTGLRNSMPFTAVSQVREK